nr:MAG TPA: hypothetical protein [Crassvirales sp.]
MNMNTYYISIMISSVLKILNNIKDDSINLVINFKY